MACHVESSTYTVNGGNVHALPIHYHLQNNDRLAAMDAIRRGANPLDENEHGVNALELVFQQLFKVLNKCVASPVPLGIKNFQRETDQPTIPTTKDGTPILSGLKDYSLYLSTGDTISYFEKMQHALEYYVTHENVPVVAVHSTLYSKAKSLVKVIKTIAEIPKYTLEAREMLCDFINKLEEPFLYYVILDYSCKESHADGNDLVDARRVYNKAIAQGKKPACIFTFLTQICQVISDLFETFHFNVYRAKDHMMKLVRPGYDSQLQFPSLPPTLIEIYAHLAFVTQANVMFEVFLLQEKFYNYESRFDWHQLLTCILNADFYEHSRQALLRKTLAENVHAKMCSVENRPK